VSARRIKTLAALARAHLRLKAAEARVEKLKATRDRRLAACAPLLAGGEWIQAGPFAIRLRLTSSGERFRLADYRAAGNRVTRAMARHISPAGVRRQLDVRPHPDSHRRP